MNQDELSSIYDLLVALFPFLIAVFSYNFLPVQWRKSVRIAAACGIFIGSSIIVRQLADALLQGL
ncbi:MAG: hypothetical protein WBW79_04810 [Desulfocapsaceae bacterium]